MHPLRPRPVRTGLAACALLLAVNGSASAQYAFDDEIMPPRAVAWRLADRGFTGIGRPRFDGRAYVVEALGPDGAYVRLFVDASDGAILGRRRLDRPPMALARPTPGYGWTEEDDLPRRPIRQPERLLPPADIPMPGSRFVPLRRQFDPETGPVRPDGSIGSRGGGGGPDLPSPNAQGLNPDARGRTEPPRKVARIGTPAKAPEAKVPDTGGSDPRTPDMKAQTRTVPEAPKLRPVDAAKPADKPEAPVAAVEPPKPVPLPAAGPTPAAVQPPSDGTAARPAEAAPLKSVEHAWKDPPEGKRNVRVIGGATVVPGTAEKEPAAP
ncbi:hypothetical protein [uncultured Methylobacterium sp.]|uniref:hypothetical protein n=1 Tax=uncultured Methylobacterium sp. TaxID=157278 RepID=UPI0035CB20B3